MLTVIGKLLFILLFIFSAFFCRAFFPSAIFSLGHFPPSFSRFARVYNANKYYYYHFELIVKEPFLKSKYLGFGRNRKIFKFNFWLAFLKIKSLILIFHWNMISYDQRCFPYTLSAKSVIRSEFQYFAI